MLKEKLFDFVLFNFLAKDKENVQDIMEAGKGFVVPGIVASDFSNKQEGASKVKELKEVVDIVSIGLGGGGDPVYAKRVLDIAAISNPGHINQPFESAIYAKGFLEGKGASPQLVNALVKPSGTVGTVKLASGMEVKVEEFVEIALVLGVESIKFMPLSGEVHLEELVYLTKVAAQKGIRGIEPAGGISAFNIKTIIDAVKKIEIEFFMPHIFGSTIDQATGKTIPTEVAQILNKLGA
ncbi:4-hydroxy-2-ketovalerate aldolase [Niallia circulans]|jgi:2-dehydro-3-deoxy-phosphogluconate aldolase|uniref:KDGP aldolase n=1 Tax=Niallia TaxID=2837506 RepID=UPI00077C8337|nr:KDGP aldolase [Niallia circulans]MDR4317607.1 oxo-acid lyase [Niallia circulans]MED3841057.1 KDGP aldolase [Niallia circulans]MED4245420.1 KDGP aldolase [Niallia circulans]MED4249331.1 KDGP aldolase [Niallia circulans]MED5099881.1 KDGP aldolase [Niallia circulans]